ncbi:hypothetical protein MMC11_004075 [Xylographa trunciseda]|nr:hypothetical protein [Xylographa trunciseda]
MSSLLWNVNEHIIQASHIRGFARDDISTVFAHGVGSSKESYEPFFDDLLQSGVPIRAIWAADAAHHGASYVLNEEIIGDEPNFCDLSRDFTRMINHFQQSMPPPLVGMGQSAGGLVILDIAKKHLRLFAGLVLMGSTVGPGVDHPSNLGNMYGCMAVLSAKRRDIWPAREGARKSLKRTSVYGRYDLRAFERMIEFDLRDLSKSSTSSDPSFDIDDTEASGSVYYLRANPPLPGYPESPDYATKDGDSFIAT